MANEYQYKRVLLKLSGEALAGDLGYGIDPKVVDDLAEACVFLMEQNVGDGLYNIGTGQDISINALAEIVMDVVGFQGRIRFDASKPDGTPRKLLNVERMHQLGWQATVSLRDGIARAYADFQQRYDN